MAESNLNGYVARLERLDTAGIADAQQGLGILEPTIRTVVPGLKVAGPAFTVKCYPGSIITVHKALLEAAPGDILVIDGEGDGRAGALIGELMAREARDRGLRGAIVDGAVRDVAGLHTLRFPAFARHVSPRVGVNRRLGSTQVAISIGGVVVHPGDYVLADDDGVAIIPRAKLVEIVAAGEAIEQKERGLVEAIDRHERLADLLGMRATIEGR
jgi:4-hydroxy-4-methyl-2-oxoglutarate aldolase